MPQTPEEPIHDRFVESCHQLDYVEYLLDGLSFGDSYERQEVVNDWLKDNKSTTAENSATGQRYIRHEERGSKVLLFVREFKTDSQTNGAAAYTYLGTASYVKHEGSKPMNITWKLDHPIPAKFLKKTNKLVVG